MARLFFFLVILFFFAQNTFAQEQDMPIENYIPPPMFDGNDAVISHKKSLHISPYPLIETNKNKRDEDVADTDTPPLPPRRPEKLKVPQSYIQYLRKRGSTSPPTAYKEKKYPSLEDTLVKPSAQDVLRQINPQ